LYLHETSEAPSGPSKSALKKAARIARLERNQQQKLAAKARRAAGSATPPETSTPVSDAPISAPEPVKKVQEKSVVAASPPAPPPTVTAPAVANGKTHAPVREPVVTPKPHIVQKPVEPVPPPPVPAPKSVPAPAFAAPTPAPVTKPAAVKPAVVKPAAVKPVAAKPIEVKPVAVAKPVVATKNTAALEAEKVEKRQKIVTRTLWTFIMIGGFIGMSLDLRLFLTRLLTWFPGLLLLGHGYMVLLVMLCQTLVYREVTALFSLKSATAEVSDAEDNKGKDPWSKTLNWYFFAATNYFLYGESIIYYFKVHHLILYELSC
jgi:phosphatidate cytidylyltransferase